MIIGLKGERLPLLLRVRQRVAGLEELWWLEAGSWPIMYMAAVR